MHNFLPDLPEGYHWQLCNESGNECTGDFDHHGEQGLRKWVVEGRPPEGIKEWEQFESLGEIPHRLDLRPVELP